MSISLASVNNNFKLLQHFGNVDKSGIRFSSDCECAFIKGKVELVSFEEKEAVSSSGRSVKVVKIPKEIRIVPVVDISPAKVAKSNMNRMLISLNPKLFVMGTNIVYPTILEPLTEDKIFVSMTVAKDVSLAEFENLDHFVRIHILN